MRTFFTVYFDGKFWSGAFERFDAGGHSATKVVFGDEPSDAELYEFIRKHFGGIVFSSPSPIESLETEKRINPKRAIRMIRAQVKKQGLSSKSHAALKKAFEEAKTKRKKDHREKREAGEKQKFKQKQMKKKNKKRGH